MDINYHYFAVKTIAVEVGFNENDAQTLAVCSQFVDDFDTYRYLHVDSVPDFAKPLARKIADEIWLFNPVTTGFNRYDDYMRLSFELYQRLITVPFHFIPKDVCNQDFEGIERLSYITVPARFGDKSTLMGKMASEACDKYRSEKSRYNLIRIGLLLHIFADTYAHQRFSGFHGWENHSILTKVIDNSEDGKDITENYNPKKYYMTPSIGHANVSHAPDDSNVTFTMAQKLKPKGIYDDIYTRNNTETFLKASKEIYNFLASCLRNENFSVEDDKWAPFSEKLEKGFLTSLKDVPSLIMHWKGIFEDEKYIYSYDKSNFISNSIKVAKSEGSSVEEIDKPLNEYTIESQLVVENNDFFIFNMVAAEVCNRVNGLTDFSVINRYFDSFCSNF